MPGASLVMAYTQQQVDDLRAAIAEGVTTVSSSGRTIVYRSLAEMMQVLRTMEGELASAQPTGNRRTYLQFQRD
jgi:hypothetical protein